MDTAVDFFLEVIVPIGVLLAACFLFIFFVVLGITYADCRGFESGTGIQTRYSWGCYANIDGKWVPKDYAFGDAHELRLKDKQ